MTADAAPCPVMPPVMRPARDLRLDILRGWMQISIFVSHVVGTGFAWAIHAAWGLSDSSEQFVLLSGFGLGSVFALKASRGGWQAGARDLWPRIRRLWVVHLTVACVFAAMVLWAEMCLPLPGEVDRLGWRWLVETPWLALPGLATMLYQPDFIGILPVFVWCMLLLPGFAWLAGRVGAWALLPSAALWLGVQLEGWRPPGLGGTEIAFNPLAWQFLFLLGAFFGRRALLTGAAVRPNAAVTALALGVVALGLVARLAGHGFGHGWLAEMGLGPALLQGKTDLAPLPLAHALALAWLAAVLIPRHAAWMEGAAAQALARVGRHSLAVFCLGLFLSWGASTALRLVPGAGPWLDVVLVLAGAGILLGFAWVKERGGLPRAASERRRA